MEMDVVVIRLFNVNKEDVVLKHSRFCFSFFAYSRGKLTLKYFIKFF